MDRLVPHPPDSPPAFLPFDRPVDDVAGIGRGDHGSLVGEPPTVDGTARDDVPDVPLVPQTTDDARWTPAGMDVDLVDGVVEKSDEMQVAALGVISSYKSHGRAFDCLVSPDASHGGSGSDRCDAGPAFPVDSCRERGKGCLLYTSPSPRDY